MRQSPIALVRRMIARPIAHRGLHAGAAPRENSLAAAEAAIAAGYAVECDVQLSADDVPIVFHDETLDRVTTATGAVRDRTAAELTAIPFAGSDQRIPTLSAFLDLVAGRAPLFIELKRQDKRVLGRVPDHGRNRRLADATTRILKGYAGDAALMSFDPRLVLFARRMMPERPRGIVALGASSSNEGEVPYWQHWAGSHLLHLPATRPHFIAYEAKTLPAPSPVGAARRRGIPLLTWTVRSQAEADRLAGTADQIIFEDFVPAEP